MMIRVELRNEQGEVEQLLDGVEMGPAHLPGFEDKQYPYLRLIDPYGDTVFSSYQMVAVVPELEALAATRPSHAIEKVLGLARRCSGQRLYLAFVGD